MALTRASTLRHPVRLVPIAFLGVIILGTLLLALPIAHASGTVDLMAASFTTVSAVCVTGLSTVDTQTFWTPFGQVVIILLVQVGGFGIMTLATLISLLVRGRLRIASALVAQTETQTLALGDIAVVLKRIFKAVLLAEALIALALTARFATSYDLPLGDAVWHGVFHSVSAFNNAGFALYSTNLVGFVSDAFICWPICAGIIAGGIGFPVAFELHRNWRRPDMWSTHTRITFWGYLALFVVGLVGFLALEWNNPATLGGLDLWGKMVAGVTGTVVPRTAGFNSVDYGAIHPATLVLVIFLMFVGGGSAGTAGGIKVSTFFLLGYVILTEVSGEREVIVGHRRIPFETVRQAVAVALLGVGVVVIGTVGLSLLTDYSLDKLLFEAVSAFGTVGLTTGITPSLPPSAQLVLMVLMFVGRVGTVTAASAFALRARQRHYHLPEERPIVG